MPGSLPDRRASFAAAPFPKPSHPSSPVPLGAAKRRSIIFGVDCRAGSSYHIQKYEYRTWREEPDADLRVCLHQVREPFRETAKIRCAATKRVSQLPLRRGFPGDLLVFLDAPQGELRQRQLRRRLKDLSAPVGATAKRTPLQSTEAFSFSAAQGERGNFFHKLLFKRNSSRFGSLLAAILLDVLISATSPQGVGPWELRSELDTA